MFCRRRCCRNLQNGDIIELPDIQNTTLKYEVFKTYILDPNDIAPTLVAMDMQKLYVVDDGGLRKFTLREGLRLFGYPENFKFDINEKNGFDLLGNTVVVPVIKAVCKRLISSIR